MNIKEEEHDYQRPDGLKVSVKKISVRKITKKPPIKNYNNWL